MAIEPRWRQSADSSRANVERGKTEERVFASTIAWPRTILNFITALTMNNQNPYSSGHPSRRPPNVNVDKSHNSVSQRDRERHTQLPRLFGESAFVVMAGVLARWTVYWGDYCGWNNFNDKHGFWGTQFLRTYLYACDENAIHVVGFLYFLYGLIGSSALVLSIRACAKKSRDAGGQKQEQRKNKEQE